MTDKEEKETRHSLVQEMFDICEEAAISVKGHVNMPEQGRTTTIYVGSKEQAKELRDLDGKLSNLTPEQLLMFLRMSGIPEEQIQQIIKDHKY